MVLLPKGGKKKELEKLRGGKEEEVAYSISKQLGGYFRK